MLERAGNFHDLRLAAGATSGEYRGPFYIDSDLYKWLEALGYERARGAPELEAMADEVIGLVERAQAEDGYLNTYFQVVAPERRWQDLRNSHELYCAGHLFEAAVAHHEAGDDRLLRVAERFATHIADLFGEDRRQGKCGHPEIELALARLYRATGDPSHIKLAGYFVDQRGQPGTETWGPYFQDEVPVRDSREVVGHAVRQLYLNAGVCDVFMETGEAALMRALVGQWQDMVGGKLYVTGGAGPRHEGEAFGDAFELPNDRAYAETCAAIAGIFWSWRMLCATGEARYADLVERILYNGFLSGVSLDGRRYFYVNPMSTRHGAERVDWFETACCPPNVMRLLGSIERYIATADRGGVQVHNPMAAALDTPFGRLHVDTAYPWDGEVLVTVESTVDEPWSLSVRVPAWAEGAVLSSGRETRPVGPGYNAIERAWHAGDSLRLSLPLRARMLEPHPHVDATRGCLAVARGPLVYCIEQSDQVEDVMSLAIEPATEPEVVDARWIGDGAAALRLGGYVRDEPGWEGRLERPRGARAATTRATSMTAVPYFSWANRGPGAMRVWIPA